MRRHMTYANVVATLALLFAVGTGSAWAAKTYVTNASLRANSISGTKLRNGTVTSSKLARNAVTAPKLKINSIPGNRLKNGSVKLAKLAPDARAAFQGPKGDTGPQGPPGTPVDHGLVPVAVFSVSAAGALETSAVRPPVTSVHTTRISLGEYGITLNGLAAPANTVRVCTTIGGGNRLVSTLIQGGGLRASIFNADNGDKADTGFHCAIYPS